MNYISHHGIEGQHWGVRNGPPYPLNKAGKKALLKQKKREYKVAVKDAKKYVQDQVTPITLGTGLVGGLLMSRQVVKNDAYKQQIQRIERIKKEIKDIKHNKVSSIITPENIEVGKHKVDNELRLDNAFSKMSNKERVALAKNNGRFEMEFSEIWPFYPAEDASSVKNYAKQEKLRVYSGYLDRLFTENGRNDEAAQEYLDREVDKLRKGKLGSYLG